jgi:hypothetical protein
MILRRLTQSLKEQNWTAIVIEFILLVSGVFLGIQVSNWNADRETRQKSAVFTERLRYDLRAEAYGYRYLVAYNKEVLRSAVRTLDDLSGEAPLSDEQFVISAYRSTQYVFNDRFRTTYDELVSTGDVRLIADPEVRQAATTVFNSQVFDGIVKAGRDSEYRRLFRTSISHEIQHALLEHCGDRYFALFHEPLVDVLDYPCTLDAPADKIHAAASALRGNRQLAAALQLRFADIDTSLTDLQVNNQALFQGLMKVAGDKP